MSIIADRAAAFEVGSDLVDRRAHRFTGFIVAISVSVMLWGGIGTGIWGLVSLFG